MDEERKYPDPLALSEAPQTADQEITGRIYNVWPTKGSPVKFARSACEAERQPSAARAFCGSAGARC